MSLPVLPAALVELDAAMSFYEDERPGLGLELLDAVEETLRYADEFPDGGERKQGPLSAHEARRFVVGRFPYVVYVAQIHGRREVVAIAHTSREPGYWRERLVE